MHRCHYCDTRKLMSNQKKVFLACDKLCMCMFPHFLFSFRRKMHDSFREGGGAKREENGHLAKHLSRYNSFFNVATFFLQFNFFSIFNLKQYKFCNDFLHIFLFVTVRGAKFYFNYIRKFGQKLAHFSFCNSTGSEILF